MVIQCRHCGKQVEQHHRKGGRAKLYCNERCRARWKYKRDPIVIARKTYVKQRARAYSNKWKALQYKGGRCQKCGEDRPATLCFHHRDPSVKEMKLDGRSFANRRWDLIKEEVDKCDLLCHNCHHMVHHGDSWDEFINGPLHKDCMRESL